MIKNNSTFETPSHGKVRVSSLTDTEVVLKLSGIRKDAALFDVEDLKALRKFLKKLQKQLEGPAGV